MKFKKITLNFLQEQHQLAIIIDMDIINTCFHLYFSMNDQK